MSDNRVTGKNQIVEMKISGVWYPIFCCKSMDFTQEQEAVEITSVNSATGREYQAGMTTTKLSVSGVTVLDNTEGQIAITYLMGESIRRQVQTMRIRIIGNNTNTQQISFSALIIMNNLSRTFGNYSQSAVNMIVTGGITVGPVDPPGPVTVNVYGDYWVPTNGNNYVDGTSSGTSPSAVAFGGGFNLGATDTLLEVDVEGTEFEIITSGSPGNRQCKLNTSTFVLYFASDQIFDGTQKVYIEFKRTS